jgi:hypothetical protein
MEEQKQEEILEIDADQLEQFMSGSESDKLPPIEIPFEFYDADEFHKGLKDTSYLAGVITAMLNAGVDQGFVLDYLLNKETIKHNIKAAEVNKEMNIEISKNAKTASDKLEL